MNVGAAVAKDPGIQTTIADAPLRISAPPGLGVNPLSLLSSAPLAADSVGELLQQLAGPQIANLIVSIANEHVIPNAPALIDLRQSAVSAVAAYDVPRALGAVTELVVRFPDELEAVHTEPAFAPIRADVDNLLRHHVTVARTDAESKLSLASHAFEASRPLTVRDADRNVPQVLSVAYQLLATDRHANVMLAGDLAQSVINAYKPVSVTVQNESPRVPKRRSSGQSPTDPFHAFYNEVIKTVAVLGAGVSAKVLLLLWFAIGLISGILTVILLTFEVELLSAALPFEIWGAGSLGLLGYSTYRRFNALRSRA